MTTLEAAARFFSKPSTYPRLGVVLTLAGWQIEPLLWDKIALICMGGGTVTAWVMEEIERIRSS